MSEMPGLPEGYKWNLYSTKMLVQNNSPIDEVLILAISGSRFEHVFGTVKYVKGIPIVWPQQTEVSKEQIVDAAHELANQLLVRRGYSNKESLMGFVNG